MELGLAELSRSAFYGHASRKQSAVETADADLFDSQFTAEHNAFDELATTSATRAAQILETQNHDLRWLARLHLVKQLAQSTEIQSQVNLYDLRSRPFAPLPTYKEARAAARAVRERLRVDVARSSLSADAKLWLELQLDYFSAREEILDLDVKSAEVRRLDPSARPNTAERKARLKIDRHEAMLRAAMARPRVLERLVSEASLGILYWMFVDIRFAYGTLTVADSDPLLSRRRDELYKLQMKVSSSQITATELLHELIELGYSPAEVAPRGLLSAEVERSSVAGGSPVSLITDHGD